MASNLLKKHKDSSGQRAVKSLNSDSPLTVEPSFTRRECLNAIKSLKKNLINDLSDLWLEPGMFLYGVIIALWQFLACMLPCIFPPSFNKEK